MAFDLFKLAGSIFIDTKEADKSLAKTDKNAQTFGQTFGKVAGIVGGVATVVVGSVTAVGGAMISTANQTAETADEIDKASIRMGISAEQFQEFAYVAGQCGVETATLEQAAKKLEGTDINFDDAISSIMELETAEERAQKASELFGEKVAYTMAPMLQQTGEEFDALKDRAHELGLVMGEDAVKNGVEFGDLLSDLKQSFGALAGQIGSALFPILNKAMEYVLQFIPQISEYMQKFAPLSVSMFEQLLPFLFDIAEQIFPIMMDLASQMLPIFTDLVANILPILTSIISAVMPLLLNIVSKIMPLAVSIISELLPLITAILPLLEPITSVLLMILEPLVDLLADVLPGIIQVVTQIVSAVVPVLSKVIENLGALVRDVLTSVIKFIKPILQEIISYFSNLIDFIVNIFTGNFEAAFQNVLNIWKSLINIFIDVLGGAVNLVINLINTTINNIIRGLDLIPGVEIPVGFANIPEIPLPHLAEGGTLTRGGRVLVGERAPEILDLPAGARVTPLDKVGNLTREDVAEAMKEALLAVGIQLEIEANESALFDKIEAVNTTYRKRHGGASRLA